MSSPSVHLITVSPEQSRERLDKWLATLDFIPSRSRAAELIERGLITLNGLPVKASQRFAAGLILRIEIPAPTPTNLQPLDAPLDILFEDDDLIVVNKPAGLVVHPAAGHAQDTLVNILLHHVGQLSMGFNEQRPGIVHRLDRDTSGILVVAKNDFAHQSLAKQFKDKTSKRIYWALVHGKPREKAGVVRTNLARHPSDRKRFASAAQGKHAVTHYRVLHSLRDYTWIECRLETGRTHQIRVHMSESGWPILGDPIYGAKTRDRKLPWITRMALHAELLGFNHPRSEKKMLFKVGWPPELAAMAEQIGFPQNA